MSLRVPDWDVSGRRAVKLSSNRWLHKWSSIQPSVASPIQRYSHHRDLRFNPVQRLISFKKQISFRINLNDSTFWRIKTKTKKLHHRITFRRFKNPIEFKELVWLFSPSQETSYFSEWRAFTLCAMRLVNHKSLFHSFQTSSSPLSLSHLH